MGLPLVSMVTDSSMGRQGANYLKKLGLSDLGCKSPRDYVETAKRLADDPDRLLHLRTSLRPAVERKMLNYDQHVQELEKSYETMWRRHLDGAPHTAFSVQDDQVFED